MTLFYLNVILKLLLVAIQRNQKKNQELDFEELINF